MTRFAFLSLLMLASFPSLCLQSAFAAQPSERLLPPTTKAYLSVPDVDLLRENFQQTQLGELAQDPLMRPFFEDVRQQLAGRLGRDVPMNITIEDLEDVYGGEVALATVQPGDDPQQHATVLLVDITGRRQEANELLKRIDGQLIAEGARRTVEAIDGVNLVRYVFPIRPGETEVQHAFYFVRDNQLVASDHQATLMQILEFAADAAGPRLADLPAFSETMARTAEAAGETPPHIRWFIEPFGYVETLRAAAGGRQRRGTDMLRVLQRQGFDAIQGIGGLVSFASEGVDIVHRSFVYAPPVDAQERYELAARMLRFPNAPTAAPEPWVPADVANYLDIQWEMGQAFEYSQTLVDDVAGAAVFEDILDSLKHDPNGPQIDVRKGLVHQLGQRVTFFTDYRLPITPESERWLLAFKVTDSPTVATTLDRAMEVDPDATLRMIGEHRVWEILREQEDPGIEELDIAGVGFGDFDTFDDDEGAPLLEHAALTVSFDYLIVASHADFLEQVLTRAETQLDQTEDFIQVNEVLDQLGADEQSLRLFSRTDKAYHTPYELIRQGRMPEADSLLGALLNTLLGPEERGVLREQQIRGEELPPYEQIRHYFGPAGAFVQTRDDGWFLSGALLPNATGEPEPPEEQPEDEQPEEEQPEEESHDS